MDNKDSFNIPFGDGSGFDASKMPAEETIEVNQAIVNNIIGVNEDMSPKIPTENEWKRIEEYNTNNPEILREMDSSVFTIQQETEDWDYYVNNLREDMKNKSMQDAGKIKAIRKAKSNSKSITTISIAVLTIGILSSASAYTLNDIKTTFPGQDINSTTIQNYIDNRINITNEKLKFYLAPRDSNGKLYEESIPEQITNGQVPVTSNDGFSLGGR